MAENVKEIGDGDFEENVLKSEKPVMVDFWAPWCGPCKAISPIVEELAGQYGEQIQFKKCNVDDNPVTPANYGVKSIPTLLFFREGKVVDQITGMVPRSKLEESVKNAVAGGGSSQPFLVQ
jgi:thioredoxin 1